MVKKRPVRKNAKRPPDQSTRKDIRSLRELAFKVGMDNSYLSRVYSGKVIPSLRMAIRLAQELGITLDRFVKSLPNSPLSRYPSQYQRRGTYGIPKFRSKTR